MLRRLQPSNEAEDPYIVATLIALAQEQRQRSRGRAADHGTSIRSSNPCITKWIPTASTTPSRETTEESRNNASFFKVRLL